MIPIPIIISQNLFALCSGSPAPLRYLQQMTITFEHDSDVIVYALEKVISYARKTQQVFVAQCVWWLASIIGLEHGLVIHIDNQRACYEKSVQQDSSKAHDIRTTDPEQYCQGKG
jgi:hypothetical protein